MKIFFITVLGFFTAIILLIVVIYIYLLVKFHQLGFKGLSLWKIKDEIESNNSNPRETSGMTPLLLPQIKKDFKDFDLEHLYLQTETCIRKMLEAIENKDLKIFEDEDFNLIGKKMKLQLEDLIKSDIIYKYDDVIFHRHALKRYVMEENSYTIEVSSSLEYYYDKIKDGKSIYKNKVKKKKQALYITKFVYIADSSVYEKDINVYGINCPNCGAVIPSLDTKRCKYCKTSFNIQVVNLLKCWKIINCKEIK